jgi:hypothetical protein
LLTVNEPDRPDVASKVIPVSVPSDESNWVQESVWVGFTEKAFVWDMEINGSAALASANENRANAVRVNI